VSLKAFHLFFITLSVLLCLGVAGWNGSAYQNGGSVAHLAQSIGWAVAGVGLGVYGVMFLRKYKQLRYL
jgi:hypothetical protein